MIDQNDDLQTLPDRPNSTKTLVIACGALARELIDAKTLNKLDHLDITCLPAIWHNRPEKIPDGVRKKIRKARADGYADILCLYGDCGTGGMLDKVLEEEGVERIEGDHCYAFYSKPGEFDQLMDEELGSFFLTDYLVRHFDRLIIQGLGLDRYPQLMKDIFGHYKRIVYLAQMPDPALEKKARRAAERLGLAFEMRMTGLGGLETFVTGKGRIHRPPGA